MREIIESAVLAAPAPAVWAFVTDPGRFADYVDGYDHGAVRMAQSVGLGASYEWYGRLGPLRLRSTEEIVEWTEGSCVRYAGSMAGVPFRSAMQLRPAGPKATELTVAIRVDVPAWMGGAVVERLVVGRVVRGSIRRSLARLGSLLGGAGADGAGSRDSGEL